MENINIREICDYKWKKKQARQYVGFGIALAVLAFLLSLRVFIRVPDFSEALFRFFSRFGCCVVVLGLPFFCIALHPHLRMHYLVKNQHRFTYHETRLHKPFNSVYYRGAVYYSVRITVNGEDIRVNTNPMFSSFIKTDLKLKDYNNRTVGVLYDEKLKKAYVVGKIEAPTPENGR